MDLMALTLPLLLEEKTVLIFCNIRKRSGTAQGNWMGRGCCFAETLLSPCHPQKWGKERPCSWCLWPQCIPWRKCHKISVVLQSIQQPWSRAKASLFLVMDRERNRAAPKPEQAQMWERLTGPMGQYCHSRAGEMVFGIGRSRDRGQRSLFHPKMP